MSWAYSPSRKKPVSVPHSMMAACSFYGAQLVFARPEGFELDPTQIAFTARTSSATEARSKRPTTCGRVRGS